MKVRYSYLPQQFSDCDDLWSELRDFVKSGDFTLGVPLKKFENNFSQLMGVKHALGVNSGTDAIKLSLKAKGVSFGDEVITTANTFVATVGAIAELGEKPVFVDCDDTFVIQVDQRDSLKEYLMTQGIETAIHYPIPIHLQPAAKNLSYGEGSFPIAERQAKKY